MQFLRGTGVALVTPFNSDGQVDHAGLEKLINHVIENGIDYLVSLGTTGESATLSMQERSEVMQFTVEKADGRVPVVAGFGGNNTASIIQDLKANDLSHISAILSVSPYYNKPTQRGIYHHYEAISKSTDKPIILYNVPGRTSSNISADTTLRLVNDFENIVAIKEASGDLEQCMAIVKSRPSGFMIVSGDDILTLPMISFGMDGVISVVANAFPGDYSEMVRKALKGQFVEASTVHFRLMNIIQLLFAEGNPGGIKCALKSLGICGDHVRLPLANVSATLEDKIGNAIRQMSETEAAAGS